MVDENTPDFPPASADISNTPAVSTAPLPATLADPILADDMQTLHSIINAITPIDGLSIIAAVPTEIGYTVPPTPEQEAQIATVISGWDNLRAKNALMRQINADWQATVAAGWTTPYGWKLGITTQDVTLLMGAFILAKEAAAMGLPDTVAIIDTDGATHTLSLAELTTLMLGYGQARAALSAADAAVRQAVNAATTLDELNAISV